MTNCLMPQSNTTALFFSRSCNHNCDNLGHMKSVEDLWTFKAPSGSSAVVDFSAVLSPTRSGMACSRGISQFSCIPHTSRRLAVVFISLHTCSRSFIVKGSARWQEPSLSPLCHFTVYASRRLYAINKLPSFNMLYIQIKLQNMCLL